VAGVDAELACEQGRGVVVDADAVRFGVLDDAEIDCGSPGELAPGEAELEAPAPAVCDVSPRSHNECCA